MKQNKTDVMRELITPMVVGEKRMVFKFVTEFIQSLARRINMERSIVSAVKKELGYEVRTAVVNKNELWVERLPAKTKDWTRESKWLENN